MSRSTFEQSMGTYIGPIAHLKGERALISQWWPYGDRARWHAPRGLRLDEEIVFVQFNNMQAFRRSYRPGQRRPTSLRKRLGCNMHAFRESDWRYDPPPQSLREDTNRKLAFLVARALSSKDTPASPG